MTFRSNAVVTPLEEERSLPVGDRSAERTISPPSRLASILAVNLLGTAGVLLLLRSPAGRAFVVPFEPSLVPVLILCAALGATFARIALLVGRKSLPARVAIACERFIARLLLYLGLPFAFFVSFLPLASAYNLAPPSQLVAYGYLLGRMPWSDAAGYFWGANHLLDTGLLDYWNHRRPLNGALFSVRLFASDYSVHTALQIQFALFAVALYSIGAMFRERLGIWSAIAVTGFIAGYARIHLGCTLSEGLGVTLGTYAVAVLVAGLRGRSFSTLLFGTFGLTFALLARAGPFFVLPALLVWLFLAAPRFGKRRFAACFQFALAILCAFLVNQAVLKIYGTGEGAANANFAYTALALSMDAESWLEALDRVKPELKSLNEREQAAFMYHRAWEEIQRDPSHLSHALQRGLKTFLRDGPGLIGETFSFASFPAVPAAFVNRALLAVLALGWLIYVVSVGGMVELGFWILAMTGFVASMPILYNDGGFRVIAAVYPLIGACLACAFVGATPLPAGGRAVLFSASDSRRRSAGRRWRTPERLSAAVLGSLALCAIVGPYICHRLASAAPVGDAVSGKRVVIRTRNLGDSIVVAEGADLTRSFRSGATPARVTPERFFAGAEAGQIEMRPELRKLTPPFVIFTSYDYVSHIQSYVVAPPELLDQTGEFFTAEPEKGPDGPYLFMLRNIRPAPQ